MKWNKQTRGLWNVMFRKWNEMGYEHLQMQVFVENWPIELQKQKEALKH